MSISKVTPPITELSDPPSYYCTRIKNRIRIFVSDLIIAVVHGHSASLMQMQPEHQ